MTGSQGGEEKTILGSEPWFMLGFRGMKHVPRDSEPGDKKLAAKPGGLKGCPKQLQPTRYRF